MRILHLSSVYPPVSVGGAERVVSLLAEAQATAEHDAFACSLTRTPQEPSERRGVVTVPLKSRNPLWIEDSARYPGLVRLANKTLTVLNSVTAAQFAKLLDRVRPDVIHTHSMVELPPLVWAKAASRNIAIVHTLHDYDLLCIRAALFKDGQRCESRHLACRLLSAPKRAQHRYIDVAAAVSTTVLERHLQYGLFDHLGPAQRHVVWNPVALDGDASARPPRIADAPYRFGYLGRLVAHKGLGVLLDACRQLPEKGWTLRVAGLGSDEEAFRAAATGLPVEFVGFVNASDFLRSIDTLVTVPLWDEPFGLTTLEAYAAGARVIGARIGIIPEFIRQVDPGWIVSPGDPVELARMMTRAMQTFSSIAVQQANLLLDRFRPATVAKAYVDLYEQAIEAVRTRLKPPRES